MSGLVKSCNYVLLVDVVPVDQFRYRYEYSTWFIAGSDYTRCSPSRGCVADARHSGTTHAVPGDGGTCQRASHRFYVHPESPATGKHWMRQSAISFHRLKLTNNPLDQHGNVSEVKLRGAELLMKLHFRATGCHLPYGITVLAATQQK